MKPKKLLILLVLLVLRFTAISQNNFKYPITVQSKRISGTTVDTLRNVAFKVLSDNIDLNPIFNARVNKVDSTYQKPGSYTSRYDFKNEITRENSVRAWKGIGSVLKLFPVCPPKFSDGMTMNSGIGYFVLCYTPDTVTIANVTVYLNLQGSYTADAYNGIALYSLSGVTATKLTETANSGTLWSASTSNFVALGASQVLLPGYYYFAALYHSSAQTTAPSILSCALGNLITGAYAASGSANYRLAGYKTSLTALPASIDVTTLTNSDKLSGIIGF